MRFCIPIFLLLMVLSCKNIFNTQKKNLNEDNNDLDIGMINSDNNYDQINAYLKPSNLKNVSPKEYLEFIKSINTPFISIHQNNFPKGWITACDVKELLPIVNNKKVCPLIPDPLKSDLRDPKKFSTIGDEALRIINGFILGWYPCNIKYGKEDLHNIQTIKYILEKSDTCK